MPRFIYIPAAAATAPASFVFNGTDEVMVRTLSTSAPGTTIFTYSLWVKVGAYTPVFDTAVLFQIANAPTYTEACYAAINALGDEFSLNQDGTASWGEVTDPLTPDIATATWTHLVFRYDSTQGTADNRLQLYRNGTLLTDSASPSEPGASEAHGLFANGYQHQIGAWLDAPVYFQGKLAFIDVVDGLSLAPTSFAFNNGGTWTRSRYTGSFGTYGFRLDGSDGFNDTSGNGQHFTGTNMTLGANLDTGDLPPYTN